MLTEVGADGGGGHGGGGLDEDGTNKRDREGYSTSHQAGGYRVWH